MPFKLGAIQNEDGHCAGSLMDENSVGITIAGLPGLPGDPTQSQLEAHILQEMKKAMQRAVDNSET
jgi:hypothetical protein